MLLDAAYSTQMENEEEYKNLAKLFDKANVKEFIYLRKLLKESEDSRPLKDRNYNSFKMEKYDINPHAAVYILWYSQLRELINMYPILANKLKVCALPGRGFTGTWFLGILKGSVSVELGQEIIKILSTPEEQYKRLLRGVGLPLLEEFRKKDVYLAWRYSDNVWLNTIYGIHEHARSRFMIPNYPEMRTKLATKCRQLITPYEYEIEESDKEQYIEDYINKLLERLKRRLVSKTTFFK
jgi:hypothetical protein